jgi:transposase-like protein
MILNTIAAKLKRRSKDGFKGRHFEAMLILQAVSWYLRYPLSYRDIEELFRERGVEVDHSTLNCWVLVTAANVHDTAAAGMLLDRAAQDDWTPEQIKVDGIYSGPRVAAAAQRHDVDVQVSPRAPEAKGFTLLPLRWRIGATFGT